jgi:hypothetical protein
MTLSHFFRGILEISLSSRRGLGGRLNVYYTQNLAGKIALKALKPVSRYPVALLLAVTLGFGASRQSSNSTEIPLRSSHVFGLMLVEASINGKPVVLILDTASNHTVISSELIDAATPSLVDGVATEKGSGWSGKGVFAKVSLAVGPVRWPDHKIVAMDTSALSKSLGENVHGMLGMDFLKEFDMVIVDLRKHKLILKR